MDFTTPIRRSLLAAAGWLLAASLGLAAGGVFVKAVPHDWKEVSADRAGAYLDVSHLHAPVVPAARAARSTTLFFGMSEFESELSKLIRLKSACETISLLKTKSWLVSPLLDVQEMRMPTIAEELGLLPNHGILEFMPNYLNYVDFPTVQFIATTESRAAFWELNLPCFATSYDRTVHELRKNYARWEEEASYRLAQSLEGLDNLAFLAVMDQMPWKKV